MRLTTIAQFSLAIIPAIARPSVTSDKDLYTQAGSHVIFSYPGLTPPDELLDLTKQGQVGGVILFGENVDENIRDVVKLFQSVYAEGPAYSGKPLLIMTDQEGGNVRRLPGGPEETAKKIGQSARPVLGGAKAGATAASVLKGANVNCNLAPVLDIYRTPDNFSISKVGLSGCSTAFIAAQQSVGVIATAKHFPGLGPAGNENTDLQPVTIDTPLKELRAIDELPYMSAIAAGVDIVMASWAIYPALDVKRPAGMSKAWIQGELRKRLGFKGVTITDAIEAGGLKAFGDDAERGLLASQAGMDLLLASGRNITQGRVVVDALVQSLKDGSLPIKELMKQRKESTSCAASLLSDVWPSASGRKLYHGQALLRSFAPSLYASCLPHTSAHKTAPAESLAAGRSFPFW
ncbi:hypothetical protein AJ80_04891 [Polytolypa hystricis UAMH7299]|uniref:Glycoside hydrolase family 3 N-terminal domain-containing protein n=1 Tax=Polytolypa hystricis (strain UAMH7299) TaxID=1447883 RepID=A0A2B7Y823_POLH7|nr:hypothetical protein AJ80_04891 [Polytolypa hystricis UAMH7299]